MGDDAYDQYSIALALGSVICAHTIAQKHDDKDRRLKMQRVRDEKLAAIRNGWPAQAGDVRNVTSAKACLRDLDLDGAQKRTLLIDLDFSDPFAPYELKFDEDDLDHGLHAVADVLRVPSQFIDEITQTRKQASRAHKKRSLAVTVAFGLGGAALLAAGGWMAAPVIAGYLGASAGLAGATATAHGLALLGGGTLAAGGAGMAGGMAVVAGGGAALGGVMGGGGALLFQLGGASTQTELLKLQVTFKAVVLGHQQDTRKAQVIIGGLRDRENEVRKLLKEQERLNDEKSQTIRELTTIIEALERSRGWIQEQHEAA